MNTGPPPITASARMPKRFLQAWAAAFIQDDIEIRDAFRDLTGDEADALGQELLAGLAKTDQPTGDWRAWAFACNRIPWSYLRNAAAGSPEKTDAQAAPADLRHHGISRRRLAGLALRLLRGGIGGRELLRQLDVTNAKLQPPLPAETVGEVAVWAAGQVRGDRHA